MPCSDRIVPGQFPGRTSWRCWRCPAPPSEQVRAALAAAAARGTPMVSICTGAFVLAAAGLLDGRRATTHWQEAAALARGYPAVTGGSRRAGALDELRAWAVRHLDESLTVDQLARQACLSRRTLIRRFHDETGLPPMQGLLGARVDRARELLEASDAPMEVVARRSGLGTPANLRALFKRHTGVPPSTYRGTFRRPGHRPGEIGRAHV